MRFDPHAGLGWWEISITLAGRVWTIPPVPAADWIAAVITGGWSAIVPGMIAEDTDDIESALLTGELDWEDIRDAAYEALETAAGVRWWIAQRLIYGVINWEQLGGEMLLRGIRFDNEPLSIALITGWRILVQHLDDNKRAELEMKLEMPPTDSGLDPDEMDDEEANADAFTKMGARG